MMFNVRCSIDIRVVYTCGCIRVVAITKWCLQNSLSVELLVVFVIKGRILL